MAVIEILKRGNKFYAQMRTDDGRIDKIAGSWDSQKQAQRGLLNWKSQVNRASIKVLPISPLPPRSTGSSDESLHGSDSQYSVDELMDLLKPELIKRAESMGVEVDSKDTKAVIAQNIVNAQTEANDPIGDEPEEDGIGVSSSKLDDDDDGGDNDNDDNKE